MEKGLDSGTAYEIISIDIADIDIGRNIGANLQSLQAEADNKIAQARAEERRAMAVAREQEMKAAAQEQRAKVIEAEAEAEKARVNAKGDADAIYAKMEAEAKGLYEILTKQAAGYDKMVEAAGGDANKAYMLLLLEKLPELVKTQVEAVKGVNIDHVTVWDSGNGTDGKGSTANFVSGLMKSVPPLSDLFDLAGMNLPEYLGKKSAQDITPVEEVKK